MGCPHGWVPVVPVPAHCPQACHVAGGSAGLVPSQLLEEKRKAFVRRDGDTAPTAGTEPGGHSRSPSPHGRVPMPHSDGPVGMYPWLQRVPSSQDHVLMTPALVPVPWLCPV